MNPVISKWPLRLFFIALSVFVSAIIDSASWAQQPNLVPVLIGFNRQPGPAQEALVRGAGGRIKYTYRLVPGIAATLPQAAIDALRRNPMSPQSSPTGSFIRSTQSWTTLGA